MLAFYESAYRAGAIRAQWRLDDLASPDGVTDPVLAAARVSGGQHARPVAWSIR